MDRDAPIPILFSVRAATSTLLFLYNTFKPSSLQRTLTRIDAAIIWIANTHNAIGDQFLTWFMFLFGQHILAAICLCIELASWPVIPVVYFWNLLWNPNSRSILEMLRDPEGEECIMHYSSQHWRARAEKRRHVRRRYRRVQGGQKEQTQEI